MKNFKFGRAATLVLGLMLIAAIGFSADFKEVKKEMKKDIERIMIIGDAGVGTVHAATMIEKRYGGEIVVVARDSYASVDIVNQFQLSSMDFELEKLSDFEPAIALRDIECPRERIDKRSKFTDALSKSNAKPSAGYRRIEFQRKALR